MKKKLFLAFIISSFLVQPVFSLTGREIMEKSDQLPEPRTAYSDVLMQIHKGSSIIEKEFKLEVKKYNEDERKSLISFSRPSKIKLLTHTHKSKDDDQWLRMSSGKVKRITSSAKSKSFVNSHFCYEDLTSRKIDDYDYKLLGSENALGEECYKVESIKKKGKKVYDKVVMYVRKSDYFVVKIDFFRKGKYLKTLENNDIRMVKGILTPHKAVMIKVGNKGKTELQVVSIKYDTEMKNSKFKKEALR